MIKAIIFDCFGVLITDAFQLLLEGFEKHHPEGVAEVLDLVQLTNRGLMSRLEFAEHVSKVFGLTTEEYFDRLNGGEVKDKALFAYIKELRVQYKTAILSNVSHEGFWRRFAPEELEPFFDEIVLSGEVGYAKPEPEAYKIAAEKLGFEPAECLMVDDREDYCTAAQAVGMRAILYKSVNQLQTDLAKLGVAA